MMNGGNDPRKPRIICPYFHRFASDDRTIVCEGSKDGHELCMRFRKQDGMEKHLQAACNTFAYARHCPIAAALEKKYQSL